MKYIYIFMVTILDKLIWYVDVGPSVHRIFLAPQVGNFRVFLGRIRAVRLCLYAWRRVPAYKNFIESQRPFKGPTINFKGAQLNDLPEMDKDSYIKQYNLLDKLVDRNLPAEGVMFDESSGSSGKPTSWVRGPKERRFVQRIMQVSFQHVMVDRQPIILNTFSMGAWATGINTTINLVGVSRVKSLGPDVVKVIDTLLELGPEFEYVICGYPPFLKLITETKEIDWSKYKITAIFGGEGISEAMRDTLLEYYTEVIGSYGASDLEINIAHESEFTIALRRALQEDDSLKKALITQNRGILPMIFQYNPYDYVIETNKNGELVVTICRLENISPRIRYNIHDLGHVVHFYELKKILRSAGRQDILDKAEFDFGVMFHYGRSDLSVDYNGAVVGPEEVKQIINAHAFASKIKGFRLISYEDKTSSKHLMIAVELEEGTKLKKTDQKQLLDEIITQLKIMNLDFKSAYSTAANKPELKAYEYETGIFDVEHQKLKNDYVWNIDYKRAVKEKILLES
ncbi:TPA: CoF synthetase [Candidatus Saccharibacteria bacterium]|nr:CoF synthetase [Candidatus Saccharibacteria bacterium]HIO87728.1 CoF synthetase [Candidatus Saccharibacteria bacterium]